MKYYLSINGLKGIVAIALSTLLSIFVILKSPFENTDYLILFIALLGFIIGILRLVGKFEFRKSAFLSGLIIGFATCLSLFVVFDFLQRGKRASHLRQKELQIQQRLKSNLRTSFTDSAVKKTCKMQENLFHLAAD